MNHLHKIDKISALCLVSKKCAKKQPIYSSSQIRNLHPLYFNIVNAHSAKLFSYEQKETILEDLS